MTSGMVHGIAATIASLALGCGGAPPGGSAAPGASIPATAAGAVPSSVPSSVRDAGVCASAASFDALEAWAASFRLPKERAPSKGVEVPSVTMRRAPLASSKIEREVRIVDQAATYVLAGEQETRRFLLVDDGDVVTGCAIGERVVGRDEPRPLDPLRAEDSGGGSFELTNRAVPDVRGMIEIGGGDLAHTQRHLCVVDGGMLGCVTVPGAAEVRRVGADLEIVQKLVFGTRRGPYLVKPIGGSSVILGERGLNVAAPIVGRATAGGATRVVLPASPRPRVDPSRLEPFTADGACATFPTKIPEGKRSTDHASIGAWVESFLPDDPAAGWASPLGELGPDLRVEVVMRGILALGEGPGHFVLAVEASHVAACLIHLGGAPYVVIDGSFQKVGDRSFAFRMKRTLGGAMSAFEEERFVSCSLRDHRLGCASAPSRWKPPALSVLKASDAPAWREATLTPAENSVTWSEPNGARHLLGVTAGRVEILDVPGEKGASASPRVLQARSALAR